MLTSYKRIAGAVAGIALGVSCALPALADDTEIYVNASTPSPEVRPNILFIVDTSGSMDTKDVTETHVVKSKPFYDYKTTYDTVGSCGDKRIFFRRSGDPLPECSSPNYIQYSDTVNKCAAMLKAVDYIAGRWTGKTAQFDDTAQQWLDLKTNGTNDVVECLPDSAKHGETAGSDKKWARNGDKNNKWTKTSAAVIDWTQRTTYTFYSSNWMNWRYAADGTAQKVSRLAAVQDAAIGMTASIDGVNLGLMRYSNNKGSGEQVASGGYVVQAVDDVTANRDGIIDKINKFSPDGNTPLSETLYEAYRYYAGRRVKYGNDSVPGLSVDESRTAAGGDHLQVADHRRVPEELCDLSDRRPADDGQRVGRPDQHARSRHDESVHAQRGSGGGRRRRLSRRHGSLHEEQRPQEHGQRNAIRDDAHHRLRR